MSHQKTLLVSPWTVVMAVRYGLGRSTYAHDDACALVREHWTSFDDAMQRKITDDLRFVVNAWLSFTRDVRESSAELLAWCEGQATT